MILKGNRSRNTWANDPNYDTYFLLTSDSITIINPLDEDLSICKNQKTKCQYQHGCVSVAGDKYSAGLVFRVVKSTELYYIKDDAMTVEGQTKRMDNIHGVVGFGM